MAIVHVLSQSETRENDLILSCLRLDLENKFFPTKVTQSPIDTTFIL